MSSKMLKMKEKIKRINPLKSPRIVVGHPVPSPRTIQASEAIMKRNAEITAARLAKANSATAAADGPPPNPPPKGPLPDEPLFTKHRAILFVLANESHQGRAEYLAAMSIDLREIIEGLQEKVFEEMELRGVAMAHAMSLGRDVDDADLTELQMKDAVKRETRVTLHLPLPFSAIPRRVDTMSVLPGTTPPRPYTGGSLKKHEKHKQIPKPAETAVAPGTNDERVWETVTDMGRYGALLSRSSGETSVRVTADGGRFYGSSKAKEKKNSPIKESAIKKPSSWNKNFQDIVDDFIAQETGLLRQRNALTFDSRRSEKDTAYELMAVEPVNQAIVDNASVANTPLIRVTSTEKCVNSAIFNGKDGALQTKEAQSGFRSSVSAPGRLTRSDTVLFNSQLLDESQTMGPLLSSRLAPPQPAEEDEEEDPETPYRVTTSFVGGMKRMDTMSNLHAKPAASSSDVYSDLDDIASPVPFKAPADAGSNARDVRARRLNHLQNLYDEAAHMREQFEKRDVWSASHRDSVMELKEQAIVAKRLKEEEAAKAQKSRTPDKESRKKAYKAQRQQALENIEHQLRLFKEQADEHKRSLEDADRDDFSPPKEDNSSPLLMGKQGSEVYLRRNALTQFSEASLFSEYEMPTPTQWGSGGAVKSESPDNLFSSPRHKPSPLGQPPLNAMDSMSMSDFTERTSAGKYLSGFPIPVEGRKLQKSRPIHSVPNMAHASSDDKFPSSPSNRLGTGSLVDKWKTSLGRSSRSYEMSFSDVEEVDEIDPNADWGRPRQPKKKIEHSQSLMAMFQEPPSMPSAAAKEGLSPSQFAPGMVLTDTSGIFSLRRGKTHKRTASEQRKLKKLYEDQINSEGSYSTPSINRGGDVATPAPVFMRMHGFGTARETTAQRQEYHEHNDMNGDENAGESANEEFVRSPGSVNSEALLRTPLSQNPNRYSQAPFGTVSSLKKKLELAGVKSAPLLSGDNMARSSSSPMASTTPPGSPLRRTGLTVPDHAPFSSSPLNRVMSAPESPKKGEMSEALAEDSADDLAANSSRRSFLPNSQTIPHSLVTNSTVIRQGPAPVNRSPEREPYVERSRSMARLSSMMHLTNPRDEEERSFARFARNMLDFADGKRMSKRASRMD